MCWDGWGARVAVPPPGGERVIHELREIHVLEGFKAWQEACGGRAWKE